MTERYTTTDGGAPARERQAIADDWSRRPDPAAGSLPDRADGPVQPGAHPGAATARKGRRRFRALRGDRGRQQYTRAAVFQPGTKTETLIRFSTVAGERGSPDTWRDPRGFSLKFYTTEGNYDMVGNNTPVFFMRDPMKFQHFIRSQKRCGDTTCVTTTCSGTSGRCRPKSAHR